MNFKHWLLSNTQIEGMLRHQHVHSEHLIAAVLEVREYRRIHGPLGADYLINELPQRLLSGEKK